MKRSSTAAEKRHMQRVSELGCALCRHNGYMDSECEIHHVRTKHGWGRSSHMDTIGLCFGHHRGQTGVHSMGRDEFTALHGISELELLAQTHALLGELN